MIELLNSMLVQAALLITVVSLLKWGRLHLENMAKSIESLNNVLDFVGKFPKWLEYYNNLYANVQILEDKKDRLQVRFEDVMQRVEDERYETGRKPKKEVDNWLSSTGSKLTDVKAILLEIDRGTKYIPEFLYRAWWGNQVERKIHEVDDLYGLGVFEEVLSCAKETAELPSTELVGEAADDSIGKIKEWLRNGVTLIGVHGEEGIGKTALMKHIHNWLLREGNVHVYMVTIPEDCRSYRHLQSSIASAVGVNLQEEDVQRRAAILHQALKRRSFVLILDGLERHFSVEDDVGIPLDSTRGKLIITSRSPNVCRRMGCPNQYSIKVTPLVDDEALGLFKQKLQLPRLSDDSHPELQDIAKQIVYQCSGVAGKIVEKAVELRGTDDLSVWQKVLTESTAKKEEIR